MEIQVIQVMANNMEIQVLSNDMELQVIQVLANNMEIQVSNYTPIDYECQLNIIYKIC
jgi:hypothetical protein